MNNLKPRKFFDIKESKDDVTDVYLYDEIWDISYPEYGVESAKGFINKLNDIETSKINLFINSPGGIVDEGISIYNALKRHEAKIHVFVDGLAASIASVIAMAGDTITVNDGAFLMIHDPWTMTGGNSKDMRKSAEYLDQIGGAIADIYTDRTGIDNDAIKTMMSEETWIGSAEAKEKGFADNIKENSKAVAFTKKPQILNINNVPGKVAALFNFDGEKPIPEERKLERVLRDAGVSKRKAAAMVAHAKTLDNPIEVDNSQEEYKNIFMEKLNE